MKLARTLPFNLSLHSNCCENNEHVGNLAGFIAPLKSHPIAKPLICFLSTTRQNHKLKADTAIIRDEVGKHLAVITEKSH